MSLPKLNLPRKPIYIRLNLKEDFFQFFKKIEKNFDTCFLLESLGTESYTSRYSILGFAPKSIIRAKHNSLWLDDQEYKFDNPYYALRNFLPHDILARNYSGGLMGYISYESMNYFEPTLKLDVSKYFDQFMFGLYLDGLVYDKMTGETFYFYYTENRQNKIEELISMPPLSDTDYHTEVKFLDATMSEEEHRKNILNTIEEIKAGNTFQCQIGFKYEYNIRGDLIPIYSELRKINPSPHMYYLKFGNVKLLGASPELLFRLRNGEMETFPLAGSIRRGQNAEEDLIYAKKLLNDPKEIAEHNMLVDLHRNDIGRVARFGTVKVRHLMDIKRYSHIQHISSEVTGIIKKSEDMFSGLASTFPAGTLSGAPKIESMKIINRIEKNPRGPYGGAVGHFGFNGDCTFTIPIRSLFASGEYAYSQASGGIVYDSTPENEYDEIKRKSAAVINVLKQFMNEGLNIK